MDILVVVFFLAVFAFAFLLFRSSRRASSEEALMVARFKARFETTPRSSKSRKAVEKKLTQLRRIASEGTSDDLKEYEIAIKIAKQFGLAQ